LTVLTTEFTSTLNAEAGVAVLTRLRLKVIVSKDGVAFSTTELIYSGGGNRQLLITGFVLKLSATPPDDDCIGLLAGLVYETVTVFP